MKDIERMVLLTARHGEKFLGWVPVSKEGPQQYVSHCARNNIPVILEDVRLFHAEANAQVNQAGQVMGIKTFAALLPLALFSKPMEQLHVLPSSWFFPADVPSSQKKIEELLEAAEKNEKVSSAMEAGIHIPGRA